MSAEPKEWPRLSETLPTLRPGTCSNCGCDDKWVGDKLTTWQEHDADDQPELRYVILCERCSEELIEKHPRLYGRLDPNAPMPGAHPFCSDCLKRSGLRCLKTRAAGGPGIVINGTKGLSMHVDGVDPKTRKRFGRWITTYPLPPGSCNGKEITP